MPEPPPFQNQLTRIAEQDGGVPDTVDRARDLREAFGIRKHGDACISAASVLLTEKEGFAFAVTGNPGRSMRPHADVLLARVRKGIKIGAGRSSIVTLPGLTRVFCVPPKLLLC